jgi:hypothetical protein
MLLHSLRRIRVRCYLTVTIFNCHSQSTLDGSISQVYSRPTPTCVYLTGQNTHSHTSKKIVNLTVTHCQTSKTPNHSKRIELLKILFTFRLFYKNTKTRILFYMQFSWWSTIVIQSIVSHHGAVQINLFQLETVIDR